MIKVLIEEGVEMPTYATNRASGFDVRAVKILKVFRGDKEVEEERLKKVQEGFNDRGFIKLRPFERILFGTGLKMVLPENTEIQVRPRSGITLKRGLTVLNSPGTIDSDYRGEIGVILYNSTPFLNRVDKDERIAQLVFSQVLIKSLHPISEKEFVSYTSERGEGGFGHTGKN